MVKILNVMLIFLVGGFVNVNAQTYLYKRVMIVKNGNKIAKNDDAHYITFNNKGFYESDKDGYKNAKSNIVEFIKEENGLHCYFGEGYYGANHYYFSKDYSRLNLKIDKNTTYVYQRELRGKTTASHRKINENNGSAMVSTISPPSSSFSSSNTSSSTSTTNSRSESRYGYVKCSHCYGDGKCSTCFGRGVSVNSYTGEYMDCPNCTNGKCSFCNGTGKRYGLK